MCKIQFRNIENLFALIKQRRFIQNIYDKILNSYHKFEKILMKNMAWNIVLIVINIFVLYPIVFVSSQTYSPPCKIENNGYTLDFSTLKGKRFLSKGTDPKGNEYIYHFAPCDTIVDADVECVVDPAGVITGMAIQRPVDGSSCFVLGQFDTSITNANWKEYKDSKGQEEGATLSTDNGSPTSCTGGLERKMNVNFICGVEETPPDNSWEVINTQGCDYTINFPTKLACRKGQTPAIPVNPSNNNKNGPSSFGSAVLIIFGISFLLYFGLGSIYNISTGKSGMDVLPKHIFAFLLLAYTGSVFFFQSVQLCLMPNTNNQRNSIYGDDRFNYENAVSASSSNVSYNKEEYDAIGDDYVTDF